MRLIATIALTLVTSASLTACNPSASAGDLASTASNELAVAQQDYTAARAVAEIFLPLLPPDKVAIIHRAEAIADTAFAA